MIIICLCYSIVFLRDRLIRSREFILNNLIDHFWRERTILVFDSFHLSESSHNIIVEVWINFSYFIHTFWKIIWGYTSYKISKSRINFYICINITFEKFINKILSESLSFLYSKIIKELSSIFCIM